MGRADTQQPQQGAAPSAAESAFRRMRADILCLRLSPGEVITERALEDMYSASRTPVREALMRLIHGGLVLRTSRAYMVAPFDLPEIEEILDFREVVETQATRLAIQHATDAELQVIMRETETGFHTVSPDSWIEMGLDFHVRVAELSRNRCIVETMKDLTTRTLRARWLAVGSETGRAQTFGEHALILDLIRKRETDAAIAATIAHTREVRRQILAAIETARPILGTRSILDAPPANGAVRHVGVGG